MRYEFLSYKNRLLKVISIPCNSKVLINNFIDSHNRLVKLYEHERYLRRQKIISNLKSDAIEYAPMNMRKEEERKVNEVNISKEK